MCISGARFPTKYSTRQRASYSANVMEVSNGRNARAVDRRAAMAVGKVPKSPVGIAIFWRRRPRWSKGRRIKPAV